VFKHVMLAAAVCLLLWVNCALAADATSAWNAVAGRYNFDTTSSAPPNPTFATAYNGSNFTADLAAVVEAVHELMGGPGLPPPIGGDDDLMSTLQDWPE
jgi:hypothetical protein